MFTVERNDCNSSCVAKLFEKLIFQETKNMLIYLRNV